MLDYFWFGVITMIFLSCCFLQSIEKREVVAIKCIKKTSLNKSSVENLMKEIEILKKIQHEHIVSLLDFQVNFLI